MEVPPALDSSETVTIRGPDHMLSVALQAVLEKANSVIIADVDLAALLPVGADAHSYLKYLYTRERNSIKTLETENQLSIMRQAPPSVILEVQGQSKVNTDTGIKALSSMVSVHGQTLFWSRIDVPQDLHRYIIGKGGQNITKLKTRPDFHGRLVDVIVPHEDKESEPILLVIQRMPFSSKEELLASDEEARQVVVHMTETLIREATLAADFTTIVVPVDVKFHGRLIGAGGSALKELLGALSETVTMRFPSGSNEKLVDAAGKEIPKDSVLLKGPTKDVSEIASRVKALVSDWKRLDTLTSFSETVSFESGMAARLFSAKEGTEGVLPSSSLGWVVRQVREKITATPKIASAVEKDTEGIYTGNFHLRLEVSLQGTQESVKVFGPKLLVPLAAEAIRNRAQKILDTVTETFSIFESKTIAALLAEDPSISDRVLRRIIGKEGRSIKKFTEKFGVHLQFAKAVDATTDEEEGDAVADVGAGQVTLKGFKADVEDAKKELLEMVETEVLCS